MDDPLQKAKDAAYYYLSFRARSVKEVRDKLAQKDYAAEIIEQVVADLERQQLLDDRDFARRWVEARLRRANGSRKLAKIVKQHEANAIMETLDACNGRRAEAARQLGISERTLRYRLASFREAGIAVGGSR